MEIKTHHIATPKTARYTTYGELSLKTKYFWFVLHGSNMLSEQMLYKFKDFDPETHFVIAPEGLSRFYVNGFGGEVVASWMTKRDRLEEIHDFSVYCSTLYDTYVQKLPESCKTIIMGFSQGGVTAMRWLHHLDVTVDFLIPYACWIPEDIDYSTAKTDWNKICKILIDDEEGVNYSIQYRCNTMKDLHMYQVHDAVKLQKEHTDKFDGKFVAFRTLLEEL